MNRRLFWTTTALLTAALGIPLSSYAESIKADNASGSNRQPIAAQTLASTAQNVVKVGEYQSATKNQADSSVIAQIKPHEMAGRQAVTLYVRDIPVLTFLAANSEVGATKDSKSATNNSLTKVATTGNLPTQTNGTSDFQASTAPVWQAAAVAAKLNQLSLEGVDANKITVSWKAGGKSAPGQKPERYSLKINDQEIVEINAETKLPDQTNSLSEAALQVTNRLRRLLGNAPPLQEVAGMPKPKPQQVAKLPKQITLGPVKFSLSGMASWYGPGFHGNRTASGEVYNQHGLTAAHRSLPFGTKVRVTNMRSGRSVVVRITDRGPYIRGRILDLSAAAARLIGVVSSGVAPVRVEVLGK